MTTTPGICNTCNDYPEFLEIEIMPMYKKKTPCEQFARGLKLEAPGMGQPRLESC